MEHSLSPVLHRAAYDALGLTGWRYDLHRIGGEGELDLRTFLDGLGRDWVGLSVTMPNKEAALALATAATEQARRIGAANTLVRREDGWIASNTDPDGVLGALGHAGFRRGHRAVVLGAGATARSAIDALARLGVRDVGFVVREAVRPETAHLAQRLGMRVEGVGLDAAVPAMEAADVIVSTLPTGTDIDLGDRPVDLTGRVLLDAAYDPWPTPLAHWASQAGATVVSGAEMLLHQAAGQIELMTGRSAPEPAMRAALTAALAQRVDCA